MKPLFLSTNISTESISVLRLSKPKDGKRKPRIVNVILANEKQTVEFLRQCSNIRNSRFKHLSISSGKTPRELNFCRSLEAELHSRKNQGDVNIRIKYKRRIPKIVPLN